MRHRTMLPTVFLALLLPLAAAAEEDVPPGWTTTVQRLDGSERRPWYLALVSHASSRHVTLLVAPVSEAGKEGQGIAGESVERSESGDLHQISRWAEQLRKEAEGWKRPSLRQRPPASSHVIGVVRSVAASVTAQNAEHGGGPLKAGDLLFVEDVLTCAAEGVVGIELMGKEDRWFHRWSKAELICGDGARVGLRGTSEAIVLHVHQGTLLATTLTDGLHIRTAHTDIAPDDDTRLLVTVGKVRRSGTGSGSTTAERIAVRAGNVVVEGEATKASVAGGSVLEVAPDGAHRVAPLDEAGWAAAAPQEPAATRDEALRLVVRVQGHWRGQPRNASITLGDDGRWRSYERQTGRSVNKAGAWEPRPGGILELTYVWTPHRSKTTRTDVFRYVLEGDALVRLRPGGAVFLLPPSGN